MILPPSICGYTGPSMLSTRSVNALKIVAHNHFPKARGRYITSNEIAALGSDHIRALRGVGRRTIFEIAEWLKYKNAIVSRRGWLYPREFWPYTNKTG